MNQKICVRCGDPIEKRILEYFPDSKYCHWCEIVMEKIQESWKGEKENESI